jgi:CubicO group peptidase (beta-lactamase class C family)
MQARWRIAMLCAALVVAGPSAAADAAAADTVRIEKVLARWDRDPRADLKAVVVMRGERIVAERYYNGATPAALHDIRSAGKSITSLLVGAAIDRGKLGSVSDRVDAHLREATPGAAGALRIEDLLTMRSGLDANDEDPASPGNEDRMDESRDPFVFALSIAKREPAGTRYVYNSLTSYLAGVTVEAAVDQPLDEFAGEVLFRPLGIRRWQWVRDASGHAKGQGNLSLTARDFARIGSMVLNAGTHDGRRVLSKRWISESIKPRVAIGAVDPYADHYGYFWYTRTHDIAGRRTTVHFASGNGGNKLYVMPSMDLVVAITSSAYGRGYGQRRSQDILTALLATIQHQP